MRCRFEVQDGLVGNQLLALYNICVVCRHSAATAAAAGFTIELCAGLIDKSKSLKEIVSEEILEEVGALVTDDIQTHEK